MSDTKTKNYDSAMVGAPVLSGSAGSLLAVLDAALVTGFGLQTVVSVTVTSGIAKATYATPHPFKVDAIARYAGSTTGTLNGDKRILSVISDKIVTFNALGVVDGAAAGTITSRVAPAGFTKAFAGANVGAYKSSSQESTGCFLRLDDTGTTTARVISYESMTDVNTGAGGFPADLQFAGGLYWGKSNVANASARNWMIFADDRAFVLWVAPHLTNQTHGTLFGWGDFDSDKSGDAYGCSIFGGITAAEVTSGTSAVTGCLGFGSGISVANGSFVARSATAIGGSQAVKKVAAHNTAQAYSGTSTYNANTTPYPNGPDNSLRLAPLELLGPDGFRGRVAGVYHTPQVLADAFFTGSKIVGEGAFAGKTMMALRVGAPGAASASAGTVWIDISGSWRA